MNINGPLLASAVKLSCFCLAPAQANPAAQAGGTVVEQTPYTLLTYEEITAFARKSDPRRLAKEFKVAEAPEAEPSYNVAPTHNILAVRQGGDGREMTFLKWGLVPSWAKDKSIGAKLINARSETIEEKPSFRDAFRHRRCVIPADGFYEWKREGGGKQL